MNDWLIAFGLIYFVFSMLFSLMWTDSVMNDQRFVAWYLDRVKNKNVFGKIYVTIFALIVLPSYLFTILSFYICLILMWIYDLGIKRD